MATAPLAPTAAGSPRRSAARIGREQRVGDILEAAREVFCERGYDNTAVSEIAARCGIVEGTIYKYFDSKRTLLLKVLEHWYEAMFGDYTRELPGLPDARARLRYLVWRHLRTIRDDRLLSRLMFMEVRSAADYRGSDLFRLNRRYTRMLETVITDGIAAGEIGAGVSARTVRDLVYGGIEHMTWNFVSGHGSLDIDRRTDELVALFWHGIAAPGRTAGDDAAAPAALRHQVDRLTRIADRLDATATRTRTRR